MNNKVVVVGSYIQDLTFKTPRLPKDGETLMGDFITGCGGKGFNSAIACSRLGTDTLFVSSLGRDSYAQDMQTFCLTENIDTSLEFSGYPTGVASIWVDQNGKNRILVDIGANRYLSEDHIMRNETQIGNAKVLMSQLECNIDAVKLAFDIGKRKNPRIVNILNTAPIIDNIHLDIFENVDIMIANESEFDDILKTFLKTSYRNNSDSCMKDLAYYLKLAAIVVTMGERGATIYDRMSNKFTSFKAPMVRTIDTTGAGDCFCGTFASKVSESNSLSEEVLRTITYNSILNASLSTIKRGTAPSMPNKEEFAKFKADLIERTIYPN